MGLADDITAICRDLSRLTLDHQSRAAGEPRDDLLQRAASTEKEARHLSNRPLIALALLHQAELLLAVNRARETISVCEQAMEALGDLRKDDLRVRALGHLAESYVRLENWQSVSSVCAEGIALVEKYRYKVSADYLASAYLRSRIGLYSWGVRAAYELKQYELAIERAELSKCRLILRNRSRDNRDHSPMSAQREAEFRELCREIATFPVGEAPEYLVARRAILTDWMNIGYKDSTPAKFRLQAIMSLLRSDEAILFYYWLDPKKLGIATIDQDGFAMELRSISNEQRTMLEKYADHVLTSTTVTYSLFEPVRHFGSFLLPDASRVPWHNKRRLFVSPHRVLHSIPFHALRYEDRWLIERAAVSYVPNLTSFGCTYIPREKRSVLVVATENFNVPGKTLSSLPAANREGREVKQIYDDRGVPTTLLLEKDATTDRLRKMEADGSLRQYSCVHFATHGENVDSNSPMESRFYMQDSLLDGLEVANLQLGADTVVLSACCSGHRPISGRGLKELPGDDLFGLQAAFFRAGAHEIVSTLWPVDSDAACKIMMGFHAQLSGRKTCDAEMALQAAVCDYLAQTDIRTSKIYFWAPFFLSVLGKKRII
jgi:CHAT domain-containing protein